MDANKILVISTVVFTIGIFACMLVLLISPSKPIHCTCNAPSAGTAAAVFDKRPQRVGAMPSSQASPSLPQCPDDTIAVFGNGVFGECLPTNALVGVMFASPTEATSDAIAVSLVSGAQTVCSTLPHSVGSTALTFYNMGPGTPDMVNPSCSFVPTNSKVLELDNLGMLHFR